MKRLFFIYFIFLLNIFAQNIPDELRAIIKEKNVSTSEAQDLLGRSGLKNLDNIDETIPNVLEADLESDIENIKSNDLSVTLSSDEKNKLSENVNLDEDTSLSEDIDEMRISKNKNGSSSISKNDYFGYNVFNADPEIFQLASDLFVSPNYEIVPNDEIILMLWGETEIVRKLTVTREGYVFIPDVGQVFVNGLNLEKLEKKLFKLLSKVYSSLLNTTTKSASTFFDVSIGSLSLKPNRIFVLGDVKQPGAYDVKSSASLFTSLFYFRGPLTSGSLRTIKLIRNGKETSSIDFYDYLLFGKKTKDIRLQNDDVVFIPPRGKTITVKGEINRSSIFELKENEKLIDLIKIAGGIKNTTYSKRAQIDRIIPFDQRKIKKMDRTIIDINLSDVIENNVDFDLLDGDIITFFKISDVRKNFVTIVGPVSRQGDYAIGESLTISELIEKADGLLGDAFLGRAEVIRTDSKNTKTQIVIDLEKAISKNDEDDIILRSNDEVKLFTKSEMLYLDNVSIFGHVDNPGTYEFKKDMTVYDLVFTGGGFKNLEHLESTYLDRALLTRKEDNDANNINIFFNLDSVLNGEGIAKELLKMGDKITIYSKSEILGGMKYSYQIKGYVKKPGIYDLTKNIKLSDALFLAGGLNDSVFYSSILLDRVDIIRTTNNYFDKEILSYNLKKILEDSNNIDPLLKDGDEILVYSKDLYRTKKSVTIEGAIITPGEYDLKVDMSLLDLLLESGGLEDEKLKYKVEIARLTNSIKGGLINPKIKFISFEIELEDNDFNFVKELNKNNKLNYKLSNNDHVSIRKAGNLDYGFVEIEGFVKFPGKYILNGESETISSIISRSGGITEGAYPQASTLTRDSILIRISFDKIISSKRSKMNFKLRDGDKIFIGGKTNVVTVNGSVKSPGSFPFNKNKNLKYYISIAGGYKKNAARWSSYVTYPDGTSKDLSIFNPSPKILDGSVITVVEKEEVEPFSFTEYVTNITSIYADVIQAIALLRIINT